VRSHDDIGWTFADEDAAEFGINGYDHRRFLNHFYVNRHPGSFARGVPFQDNPRTGDCRISGTTASLAGLEAADPGALDRIVLAHSIILSTGGLPLIYLGDEVGQLNDYTYLNEPAHAEDSRWVHRPPYPAASYAQRLDPSTDAGILHRRLSHLIDVRRRTPELAGNTLVAFDTKNPHLVAYQRPGEAGGRPTVVLIVANVADNPQTIEPTAFSLLPALAENLLTGEMTDISSGLVLDAHGIAWLRFARQ
jgi:amylosucrase